MLYRYVALTIFACTFATLSPVRAHATSYAPIIISEINWAGSTLSTADEWIEIANTTQEAIDISLWTISGISSSGSVITLPENTSLEGHATYLIANYTMGDAKSALLTLPNYVTTAVSIPNTALAIELFNAQGEIVDSYIDTGSPDAGGTSPHASAEKNLATGTWETAQTHVNLLAEHFGTPGNVSFPEENIVPEQSEGQEESISLPEEIPSLPLEESSDPLVIIAPEEIPTEETTPEASSNVPEESVSPIASDEEIITLIEPVQSEIVTSVVPDIQEDLPSEEVLQHETSTEVSSESTSQINTDAPVSPTPTIVTLNYQMLRVNEFVSSPSDSEEWIEFYNDGDNALDLAFVSVRDASNKVTSLEGTIAVHDYFVLSNPLGKLNNTSDSLTVTLSDGQTLFSLSYGNEQFPAPKKGFSAGYCSDGWHTDLAPSRARENICPTTSSLESSSYETSTSSSSSETALELASPPSGSSSAVQEYVPSETETYSRPLAEIAPSVITSAATNTETSSASSLQKIKTQKKSSKKTPVTTSIADLDSLPSGQHVVITGVVIVEPGILGKRIAYLNGVQLYFYKAAWPSLPVGTTVSITGTWDYNGENRRIKIAQSSDITTIGAENVTPLSWENIPEQSTGDILVTASGTLVKKDNDLFIFSDGHGGEIRVRDDAKTGSLSSLHAGEYVTLTGIIVPFDGTWILIPRTSNDISIGAQATQGEQVVATTSEAAPPFPTKPIVGGGILASTASALGYWLLRSRKLSFLFSS